MTEAGPLVSVVVPVYEAAAYLRESIESVLHQTYPSLEIIAMDNASTDDSATILAEFAPRVATYRQATTRGMFENINDGIRHARGELIAVHHADDVYHPEIVERQVAYLAEHETVGAVFTLDTFIDSSGRPFGQSALPRELRDRQPLVFDDVFNAILTHKNTFLRCPTALFRRSALEKVDLFPEEFSLRGDLEMWLRLARRFPLGVIEQHLVDYRYGHLNSSRRYDHLRVEPDLSFSILESWIEAEGQRVSRRSLREFAAHRAEDRLMVAVNQYIVGDKQAASETLRLVRMRDILGGSEVQRARLIALRLLMRVLVVLPRSAVAAEMFHRRWHEKDLARLASRFRARRPSAGAVV